MDRLSLEMKIAWLFLVVFCVSGFGNDGVWISEASGENATCHHLQKRSLFRTDKTVCYEDLGCFSSGPPFYHPIFRPISFVPQHPDIINTQFLLYTQRNKNRPIFLSIFKPNTIKKSPINRQALWRIIIYGLNDNLYFTTWTKRLTEVILKRADENVVVVDWSGSNRLPYSLTVANSRVVGAQVAKFIEFIHKTEGIGPESFHLIGHSLGAHIAGYAGERLENLGRITGLDPAGPWFRHVPDNVRLDPSDAIFVDVIHTNPAPTALQGLGTSEDNGDLDFYPGGGDPPCKDSIVKAIFEGVPTEVIGKIGFCQHQLSNEFFILSFNQHGCLFVGVECDTWRDFLEGHCDCGEDGERCALMGMFSPTYAHPNGIHVRDRKFYLKVLPLSPYCAYQYRIIVHVHTVPTKKHNFHTKFLNLKISGELGILYGHMRLDVNVLQPFIKKKLLLASDQPIGDVHSATMTFEPYVTDDVHYLIEDDTNVVIEKIEVNYLFPLPKKHTAFLLCRTTDVSKGRTNKFFLSTEGCY